MTGQPLQTEFEFTLPRGYVDEEGTLHKEGRMRLATAADEIQPLKNQRVQSNSSYLTIVLLSRVVTELGTLETIDEEVIQNLFVTDLEYLQSMYERVNNRGRNAVETTCPDCGSVFDVDAETGAHLRPADGEDATEMTFDTIEPTTDSQTDGDIEEVEPEAGNRAE
ncbi:hypothetical protein [Halopiger djelfimassiliensis]|uniref:hypothetical protein n=1 Tax=Halopiger djelfimassiliensis TaxID=1293047 RepID=UPI0006777B2D|nr:hypothetical protein [Halopiger djelfimassiliensis]